MSDKPKNCPYCGTKPEESCYIGSKPLYEVKCPKCGKFNRGITDKAAIDLWNSQTAGEIHACPFCGSKAEVRELIPETPKNAPIFAVVCLDCGAELVRGGSEKNAIDAWNTRQNWASNIPDREQFIDFLKQTREMLWAMEVNSDETKQLIDEFLEGMGVKNEVRPTGRTDTEQT